MQAGTAATRPHGVSLSAETDRVHGCPGFEFCRHVHE
jgi:hypothetical protein